MLFDYLKFWFTAFNEHGIHSPFVFNLLTKGLYSSDSRWKGKARKNQFIDRMLVYFAPQQIATWQGKKPTIELGQIPIVTYQENVIIPYDFILFQIESSAVMPTVRAVAQTMHNNSVWLIDRREKHPVMEKYWQEVVASSEMVVTLDFYYFGVAFKRKEQLKQHFKLRLYPDTVFRLLRV